MIVRERNGWAKNAQSVYIINMHSNQLLIFIMLNINRLIIGIRMKIDSIFQKINLWALKMRFRWKRSVTVVRTNGRGLNRNNVDIN